MVRISIFYVILLMITSCSYNRNLLTDINEVYNKKNKLGDYVLNNRKVVFESIDFKKYKKNSITIIENVVYLEDFYSCAVFTDSLVYFFRARQLERPQIVPLDNVKKNPNELSTYIYDHIKKGQLTDILHQGANRFYTHPSSILITLIEHNNDEAAIQGYDIHEFIPKEKLEKVGSDKRF